MWNETRIVNDTEYAIWTDSKAVLKKWQTKISKKGGGGHRNNNQDKRKDQSIQYKTEQEI